MFKFIYNFFNNFITISIFNQFFYKKNDIFFIKLINYINLFNNKMSKKECGFCNFLSCIVCFPIFFCLGCVKITEAIIEPYLDENISYNKNK